MTEHFDLLSEFGPSICEINQHPGEFCWLLRKIKALQPMNILEIGVERGGTLWYFARWAQNGANVVGLDIQDQRIVTDRQYGDVARARGCTVAFLEADSTKQETLGAIKDIFKQPIDFLFIDGGHGFETVSADFTNYGQLVRPGGIIALHDIHLGQDQVRYGWGVNKLWAKVKAAGYKTDEIQCLPEGSPMSFGIGVAFR